MCTALRTSVELSAIHHQCIPIDTYFFEFFSCSHLPFGLTLLFLPFWGNSFPFPHYLLCNSPLINLSLSFYLFNFLYLSLSSLQREREKFISPISLIFTVINSVGTVKNPKTIYFRFDSNYIINNY